MIAYQCIRGLFLLAFRQYLPQLTVLIKDHLLTLSIDLLFTCSNLYFLSCTIQITPSTTLGYQMRGCSSFQNQILNTYQPMDGYQQMETCKEQVVPVSWKAVKTHLIPHHLYYWLTLPFEGLQLETFRPLPLHNSDVPFLLNTYGMYNWCSCFTLHSACIQLQLCPPQTTIELSGHEPFLNQKYRTKHLSSLLSLVVGTWIQHSPVMSVWDPAYLCFYFRLH